MVEFANPLRALAVPAGGETGNPSSPRVPDQAARYVQASLRPVYVTPADIAAHAQRTYYPKPGYPA